jgi:hypothetical protein
MPGFFSAENAAGLVTILQPFLPRSQFPCNSIACPQSNMTLSRRFDLSRRGARCFQIFCGFANDRKTSLAIYPPHRLLRLADPREIRRLCGLLDPRMLNLEN